MHHPIRLLQKEILNLIVYKLKSQTDLIFIFFIKLNRRRQAPYYRPSVGDSLTNDNSSSDVTLRLPRHNGAGSEEQHNPFL